MVLENIPPVSREVLETYWTKLRNQEELNNFYCSCANDFIDRNVPLGTHIETILARVPAEEKINLRIGIYEILHFISEQIEANKLKRTI